MTYQITQAEFTALRIKLIEDHSTAISGETTGNIVGHGVVATYTFDGKALTVSILKHPFYIPQSAIFDGLQKQIDAIRAKA
jgi:hypothetical protein